MSCQRPEHLCLPLLEAERTPLRTSAPHAGEKRRAELGEVGSAGDGFLLKKKMDVIFL